MMMNYPLSHSFLPGGNMSGPCTNEVPYRSTWDLRQMFEESPESLKQKTQTPDLSSCWSPKTHHQSLPNSIMHVMSAMNPAAKAFNTQNTISGPRLPQPFVNQNFSYPTDTGPQIYSFTFFNEFGQPVNVAQYNEGVFPFSGNMVYPNPFADSAASWFPPNPAAGGELKPKAHQLNPEAEEYIPRTMRTPSPHPPPSAAEVQLPPHSSYESITRGFDPCNMPPPAQSDYGFISADGNECCECGGPSEDPANEELAASNCDAKGVPSEAKAVSSTNLFEGNEVPRNASEDCDLACVGEGSPVGSCEGAESVSELEFEDSEEEEEEEETSEEEEEEIEEEEEEESESEASDSDDGICFETVEDDDDDDGISFKDEEETLTAAVELSSFTEESSFESDESDEDSDDDSKRGSSDSYLLLQSFAVSHADDSPHDESHEDSNYDCELFNLEDDSWDGCGGGGLQISNITSTPTNSVGKWTDMVSPYCIGFDEFDGVEEEEEEEEDYEALEEELKQVNQLWEEQVNMNVSESTPTKVKFNDDILVEPVEAWCRQGPWEQYARDAMRFRSYIATVGRVLSPILATEHRDKVYQKLSNQSSD